MVEHGHDEYRVIHEYSLQKIIMYYKAGIDEQKNRLRDMTMAFGIAQSGDQKAFSRFLDSLAPKKDVAIKTTPKDIRKRMGIKTPRQQWEEKKKGKQNG